MRADVFRPETTPSMLNEVVGALAAEVLELIAM
jgi:hypothetical protein